MILSLTKWRPNKYSVSYIWFCFPDFQQIDLIVCFSEDAKPTAEEGREGFLVDWRLYLFLTRKKKLNFLVNEASVAWFCISIIDGLSFYNILTQKNM